MISNISSSFSPKLRKNLPQRQRRKGDTKERVPSERERVGVMDESEVLERLLSDLYSHTDTSEENLYGDYERLSAEGLVRNIFALVSEREDDSSSSSSSSSLSKRRAKQLALLFTSENPPNLLAFIARLAELRGRDKLLDEKDITRAKVKFKHSFFIALILIYSASLFIFLNRLLASPL